MPWLMIAAQPRRNCGTGPRRIRSASGVSGWSVASSRSRSRASIALMTAGFRGVPGTRRQDHGGDGGDAADHGAMACLRRERADEDQPPLVTVRTDPRLDRRRRFRAGRPERRGDKVLRRVGLRVAPGVAASAAPGRRCGVARDATDRSNGPCGSRAAARAGGSGA